MNIPQHILKSLEERGFKVLSASTIKYGSKTLHLEFDGFNFGGKNFDEATAQYKVVKVEQPERKPRKPKEPKEAQSKAKAK